MFTGATDLVGGRGGYDGISDENKSRRSFCGSIEMDDAVTHVSRDVNLGGHHLGDKARLVHFVHRR
jgi:hypothetical protein